MKSNKEHLLKQRVAIDLALLELETQEFAEQEREKTAAFAALGQYTPLKHATVDEDIYFANCDDKIEVEGYCTAGEILGAPAFDAEEELVLIRTEKSRLIWVPKQDDGQYEDSEDDHHLTEDEADEYITIIEEQS